MRSLHAKALIRDTAALGVVAMLSACNGNGREDAAGLATSTPGGTPSAASATSAPSRSTGPSIEIEDLYHLRSVGEVALSPDGSRVAFSVQHTDRSGAPYSRLWTAEVAAKGATPFADGIEGSAPRWSPDGRRLAFMGRTGEGKSGIVLANADGTGIEPLTDVAGSNHPLPQVGERLAWSPDGRRIAFVSAMPGPEPEMEADPIVITRYWFRPASSAGGRFSDNRRLHLFVADVTTKQVRQLTDGANSEHSIDWSPDGKQLVFLSNREPDPDFFFNYDIFVIDVDSGAERRLTTTKNNEYAPVWSPDGRTIAYHGLKRPITSSETNMEDTHVWTIDLATGQRRELGAAIDNRQGRPQWSPDGTWLYFTVQSRGSVKLHRLPAGGGTMELVTPPASARATVASFDIGNDGRVAYAMVTPSGPSELLVRDTDGEAALTALNKEILGTKTIAEVESFTFRSFDGLDVEAFLTKPPRIDPNQRHPMIVMIHGGPHGQQGPGFNHRAQVYAARGWAALMVNYRGSTGYGQAFSNAIARDQNGGEAKDVLAGVDAALSRHKWIDPNRLGVEGQSYGGQLSNWLVTQTPRFAAAVPAASISNLVSHNYMSVYHDYLEQEYGGKPHTGGIIEMLWERSAIRFANRVKTPVMFIHGDNDLLVNPAEIEQFYIALKDVGVETMMVRYPREGHGMRESKHIADTIERSIAWYDRHFTRRLSQTTD
jgi:dipeptidyl aminopeptidase/acylaminoacyl peptidase